MASTAKDLVVSYAKNRAMRHGLAAALVLTSLHVVIAQDRPSFFMPLSEVRAGMRGYGLTVFQGTHPERFDVEVIDVLHRFRPDQDLILVRTDHPRLRAVNVVAGMSGSPIYLNDRLIGAYAYGWSYGSEPVAGVTPIEPMLREMRRTPRADSFWFTDPIAAIRPAVTAMAGAPSSERGPTDWRSSRRVWTERQDAVTNLGSVLRARLETGPTPVLTPLLAGGFHESTIASLNAAFGSFGLEVLQAGGGGGAPVTPAPTYENGGAIAVTLARGDISLQAVGTVTHVEGNRVAAFGHPMLEAGETGFPTAVARVLHVLASVQRSFKIAEPVAPLGALIEDRQSAIVIDTSRTPRMIPVRLRLSGLPSEVRNEWNFEVISHPAVTAGLLASAVQSAVKSSAGDAAEVAFVSNAVATLEGLGPIAVRDAGYSALGPSASSALGQLRVFDLVEAAFSNPFGRTRVERVEINLALQFGRENAEIVDVRTDAAEVDPGAIVPVRVRFRRFGAADEVRSYRIRIPEQARGSRVAVLFQSGADVELDRPNPTNLRDITEIIRNRYQGSSMVISIRVPGRGVRTDGHVASHLPPSVLDSLATTTDADTTRTTESFARHEVPIGRPVFGGARLEIEVRARPRRS